MATPARPLILFAPPALQTSRLNLALAAAAPAVEGVRFHDLQGAHPGDPFEIDRGQPLLLEPSGGRRFVGAGETCAAARERRPPVGNRAAGLTTADLDTALDFPLRPQRKARVRLVGCALARNVARRARHLHECTSRYPLP